jgi:hypothetical protein
MEALQRLIAELELKIPEYTRRNEAISAGDIGWHIQHTCLVATRIINALKASDPSKYKWKYNWKRSYVFLINKIPRGKIKAPASVFPKDNITFETIQQAIGNAKDELNSLASMETSHYFNHPFLGDLDVKRTKKFLVLHTRHHLKIINEIIGQHH